MYSKPAIHNIAESHAACDEAASAICTFEDSDRVGRNIQIHAEPSRLYAGTAGSSVFEFQPDDDSDGVAGEVEDAAPNNGDGNNDGIRDSRCTIFEHLLRMRARLLRSMGRSPRTPFEILHHAPP
jgi:hypothetical protein